MLLHFDLLQTLLIGLIFLWTGFVRTGLDSVVRPWACR